MGAGVYAPRVRPAKVELATGDSFVANGSPQVNDWLIKPQYLPDWLDQVQQDNPYGWFRLNETVTLNATAIDNGSAASNGTYKYITGVLSRQTGIVDYNNNTALTLNGTATTYIELDSTVFGTNMSANNAFSAEMVFKITANGTSEKATAGRQQADATGWGLYVTVSSDNFLVATGWIGNIFVTGIDASTGIGWNSTRWYHVAFTCDSVISRMYINGIETNSVLIGGQPYTIPQTVGGYAGLISSFNAGYDKSRSAQIDEIILYRSALPAARVYAHACASGVRTQ
jgi:hypothetical protein